MTTSLRRTWAAIVLAVFLATGLVGCGGKSTSSAPATTPASTSASAGSTSGTAAAGSAPPSVSETGKCQKVRFALHAGLAIGAVHRYLWKPYQAGTFAQGAEGRKAALVKATLASAFAAHELKVALRDVQACPSTQALVASVHSGLGQVSALAAAVKGGQVNPESLTGVNSALSSIQAKAKANGIDVKEQEPSASQLASGGSSTGG